MVTSRTRKKGKSKLLLTLIVFVVVLCGGGVAVYLNSHNSSTAKSSSAKSYKAGTYRAGSAIPPGEYRLIATSKGNGYLEVSSTGTGGVDDILGNDDFNVNDIVTITDGQYLTFRNATAYPLDNSPPVNTKEEGTFKIGKDIAPGTYTISASKGGFVKVMSDSKFTDNSVISDNVIFATGSVTVKSGQYLQLVNASIVK